ncbi:MAG: M55 family metallopeptidase [Candidatus Poribacteria bacterium]
MKIYMHWDMEGISGIFTREHVWYWEEGTREHIAEEGRQLLIADVNSAVAAALKAGADEVIVCDTHRGGGNIELGKMLSDPRITYHVKSRDATGRWMPGLDDTVDGLMLMGHHAKAGTKGEFLPHTWTTEWADFRINGQSVGEIGIEACYAGYWNIPPIMAQGTEAACREAGELFPGIVTADVKHAESHDLCSGLDADSAHRLTAHKVSEAIDKARAGQLGPYKPTLPMTVTIRMKTAESVEAVVKKPQVHRIDEYTVEGKVDRQCDVVKWILGTGLPD